MHRNYLIGLGRRRSEERMVQNKKAKGSVLILVFFLLSRRFPQFSNQSILQKFFLRSYDPCFGLFIFCLVSNECAKKQ